MLFLNPWLLAGLAGIGLPILIHLVRRQAAKPVDWGAMRFLFDTVAIRRRKMEWEDLLLMAVRCLLVALVALALARPFVTPDSGIPWLFVLPAALVGVGVLGASFVLSSAKWRWMLRGLALLLLGGAALLGFLEKELNLKRFEASGRRDVALVIDGSDSMMVLRGGRTVFELAVDEAKELVMEAPRGTAFSVVLGGPAPEPKTAAPLTHRADVIGVLESLVAVGGTFRAHEALGVATLGLAEGVNASKEIVVFTDSQRHGWRFENPGAWVGLEDAWLGMPSKPKLLLRDFGAPKQFRNVALAGLEVSRAVVGTDRELSLLATVENSGDEAVTPGPVKLEIRGKTVGEKPVGLLTPGQRETVEFRHRFKEVGPVVVRASVSGNDDLLEDDQVERVVTVRKSLSVLLVEGNPSAGFFERGAAYMALALAPGKSEKETGEDAYLMDPELIEVSRLNRGDFDGRDVVILADVARLRGEVAEALASKVAAGCGLLVVSGPRCDVDFYNNWDGVAGEMIPMKLGEEQVEFDGVELASSTYIHESLRLFREGSDLDEALVRVWRKCAEPVEGAAQGAAFSNGDPFVSARSYGNGRSMLVSCGFDSRAGNLPAKRSFVPLVHELVTWVAGGGLDLNVESSWSPSVIVGQGGGGLSASYYRSTNRDRKLLLQRIDPAIDFSWMHERVADRVPQDHFEVEWKGMIVPPVTGSYHFRAEVDDEIELRIGGSRVLKGRLGQQNQGSVKLEAEVPVRFEAHFKEEGGEAFVRLFWTPPGGSEALVPSSVLLPLGVAMGEELKVQDPRGLPRSASIKSGRRGQELLIAGSAAPGVYEVEVGEAGKDWLAGWAGGVLPVAVQRDPKESFFEVMKEADFDMLRSRIDLVRPSSVEDILSVLQGKGFGREIWKMLAVAALVFFVLESVLARWVARSRKTVETVPVEFGETSAWEGGRR